MQTTSRIGTLLFLLATSIPAIAVAYPVFDGETDAPPAPTNVQVQFVSCTDLKLSWKGTTDAFSYNEEPSGLKEYVVSRKPTPTTSKFVGRFQATPGQPVSDWREVILDTSAWPESSITVGIRLKDHKRNVSDTVWRTIARPSSGSLVCLDVIRPATPTLTITPGGCSWNALLAGNIHDQGRNYKSGIRKLRFYRNGKLIRETDPYSLWGFPDRALLSEETYHYSMSVEDNAGNVSYRSAIVSATVPECSTYMKRGGDSVALILASFKGTSTVPDMSGEDIEDMVFGTADPAQANLADYVYEVSLGRHWLVASYVSSNWLTLPGTAEDYGCSTVSGGLKGNCDDNAITVDAFSVAGIDPGQFRKKIILVNGYAEAKQGNGIILMRGSWGRQETLVTLAHEYLHTQGVAHAAGYQDPPTGCPGYAWIGPDATDPGFGCKGFYEYGDDYSVMGSGDLYHPSAYMKQMMGYLDASETVVRKDQDVTELRLRAIHSRNPGAKHLLMKKTINGKETWFSLEFRMPVGYNGTRGRLNPTTPEQPYSVQVRLIPGNLAGDAQTVFAGYSSGTYYYPGAGIGFYQYWDTNDSVKLTTCGFSSACPSWVVANGTMGE